MFMILLEINSWPCLKFFLKISTELEEQASFKLPSLLQTDYDTLQKKKKKKTVFSEEKQQYFPF